jgi:hypothetical protein
MYIIVPGHREIFIPKFPHQLFLSLSTIRISNGMTITNDN